MASISSAAAADNKGISGERVGSSRYKKRPPVGAAAPRAKQNESKLPAWGSIDNKLVSEI